QPRLDRDRGRGMAAVVGRLRPCNIFDWKFTVLSHNTIRGAAGAAVLNGELLKAQGYLGGSAPPQLIATTVYERQVATSVTLQEAWLQETRVRARFLVVPKNAEQNWA